MARQRRPQSTTDGSLRQIQRTENANSELGPKRRRQLTPKPPAPSPNSFGPLQALLGRALKGGGL